MFVFRCSMFDVFFPNICRLRHLSADRLDDLIRADEELQFHLFELAGAEGEVSRVDFVPERLAHLCDAEGHLLPRRFEHVLELGEDGLRGFRAEISDALGILDWTDVGLEHQIELLGWCKKAAAFVAVVGAVFYFLGTLVTRHGVRNAALSIILFCDFSRAVGRLCWGSRTAN